MYESAWARQPKRLRGHRWRALVTTAALAGSLLAGAGAAHAIVGGAAVTEDAPVTPWLAYLAIATPGRVDRCGATILSASWVLTSATCIGRGAPDGPPWVNVAAGKITGSPHYPQQYSGVDDRRYAPISASDGTPVDLLLLHLSAPLRFDSRVAPLALVPSELPMAGRPVELAGYGPATIAELRVGSASVSRTPCQEAFEFCTTPAIAEPGDYGGPIVARHNGVPVLAGVVSGTVSRSGTTETLATDVRASAIQQWITSIVGPDLHTAKLLPKALFTRSAASVLGIDPTTMRVMGQTPAGASASSGDLLTDLGDGRTLVELAGGQLRIWDRTQPWTLTDTGTRIAIPGHPGQGSVQAVGNSWVMVTGPGISVPVFVDIAARRVLATAWDARLGPEPAYTVRAHLTADGTLWFTAGGLVSAAPMRVYRASVSALSPTTTKAVALKGVVGQDSSILNVVGSSTAYFAGASGVASTDHGLLSDLRILAMAEPQRADDRAFIWASSRPSSDAPTLTVFQIRNGFLAKLAQISTAAVTVFSVCADPEAVDTVYGASEFGRTVYRLRYSAGSIDVRSASDASLLYGCAVLDRAMV